MQFPLIDVLRAIAALMVLVFHVVVMGKWPVFSQPLWGMPFREGWMGVDLFLVISGFVITLSAARERQRNPEGFSLRFMQRRLRRLLPLYVLTCVLFVFLVRPELLVLPADQVLLQVLSHALFVQNLFPQTHGVMNGMINAVTWSLALEMQFYLVLVFSLSYLLRLGAWPTLMVLVGLSWLWRFGTTFVFEPGLANEQLQVIYTTQLPGTLDAFGLGIFLALLVFDGQSMWARRLAPTWSHCLLWLLLSAAWLWVAATLLLNSGSFWSQTVMIVFWRTSLALGFAAALAAVIACPLKGNGLVRPIRYLGQISYGIYLWHYPVLLALLTVPGLLGGRLFVLVVTGTLSLAVVSWHGLEKHWIR